MKKKRTSDAVRILDRTIGKDDDLRRAVEREVLHSHVASLLYEARARTGLTQKQVADLVGTQQSVIARLENADYAGHSLSMLVRVASVLEHRIEIKLVPKRSRRRA